MVRILFWGPPGRFPNYERALRAAGAPCKVMVGGAVVTEEFACQIGADFYTRDAAQSAKVAEQVIG